MVCELNYNNEMSLSDFIKALYEFENVDALIECINVFKEEGKTLEEVKKMSDEEMFKYFIAAEKKVSQ